MIDFRQCSEAVNHMIHRVQIVHYRTLREFAEQEIILPNGPFQGRRFRCDFQPYTRLLYDALDSRQWEKLAAVGPTQSGKTLSCIVIPLLWHLFELGDDVIFGVPNLDIATDKWKIDILPVIEQTRYREWLPDKGGGARGGRSSLIQFKNGSSIRFMTGGGGDKQRAAYTAAVIFISEVDGMDMQSEKSKETDKVTQLIARTLADVRRRRIYLECTVTDEKGRIWREYQGGSASVIACRCPHCAEYISPAREHLVAWEDAEDRTAALEACFACPACGTLLNDDERAQMNAEAMLVHKGQTVEDGQVIGDVPRGRALGFRWSGFNNLFMPSGFYGGELFDGANEPDQERYERYVSQFLFAEPYQGPREEALALTATQVKDRQNFGTRDVVPQDFPMVTVGVDVGKYQFHYVAVAWAKDATGVIFTYGTVETGAAIKAEERAIYDALMLFGGQLADGWDMENNAGKRSPDAVWIDSHYQPDVIHKYCRTNQMFRPVIGYGATQRGGRAYAAPKPGASVTFVGQDYHCLHDAARGTVRADVNADAWKTYAHRRLQTPTDSPGCMRLYCPSTPKEHLAISRHLTAEIQREVFVAGKGTITKWEQIGRVNHYFDALYMACAAAHYVGVRLEVGAAQPVTVQRKRGIGVRHRLKIGGAPVVFRR